MSIHECAKRPTAKAQSINDKAERGNDLQESIISVRLQSMAAVDPSKKRPALL